MRDSKIQLTDRPFTGDVLASRTDDRFISVEHVVRPVVCKIEEIKEAVVWGDRVPYAVLSVKGKPCKRAWLIRCKAVQNAMVRITKTSNPQEWVGHEIELYEDPTVEVAGDVVGGVRVRKPSK